MWVSPIINHPQHHHLVYGINHPPKVVFFFKHKTHMSCANASRALPGRFPGGMGSRHQMDGLSLEVRRNCIPIAHSIPTKNIPLYIPYYSYIL